MIRIKSKPPSKEYKENWDIIFGPRILGRLFTEKEDKEYSLKSLEEDILNQEGYKGELK